MSSRVNELLAREHIAMGSNAEIETRDFVPRLDRKFDLFYRREHDALREVAHAGWSFRFKQWWKKPAGSLSDGQLSLWEPEQQQHLAAYGNDSVFVPGRGHIKIRPGAMTKREARAAEEHLHSKGHETLDKARAWGRFVDSWPDDPR